MILDPEEGPPNFAGKELSAQSLELGPTPNTKDLEQLESLLTLQIEKTETLPEAIYAAATEIENLWLVFSLSMIFKKLEGCGPTGYDIIEDSINKWLEDEIWGSYFEQFKGPVASILARAYSKYFHIGGSWTKHDQVCMSSAPDNASLSATLKGLSKCIACGVPILKTLSVVGAYTRHPWLIMILDFAYKSICEDDPISYGIKARIHGFQMARIKQARELMIPESFNGAPDLTLDSLTREAGYVASAMKKEDRVTNPLKPWILPAIAEHFALELLMINVGQETGELDTCLLKLADLRSQEFNPPWGILASNLLENLGTLLDSAVPIQIALEMLLMQPFYSPLHSQLNETIMQMASGKKLSAALKSTDGDLSQPIVIALIEAGEAGGCLDLVLRRMGRHY